MGQELKRYDVSGRDDGSGRQFPAGTVLKLDREAAERMGLEKPRRAADGDASQPAGKPREAATKKRTVSSRARKRG